jgi:glutamate--cysteine ligase
MSVALTERDAFEWIQANSFSTTKVGRIGVELEWHVFRESSLNERLGITESRRVLAPDPHPLPAGGTISFEPGGQLELSTRPAFSVGECAIAALTDLQVLRMRASRAGLVLSGAGLDLRPPLRTVDLPWYAALERSYDRYGPWGRVMMCNSAAVQVNIDAGDELPGWQCRDRRWLLVNRLGPVLVAMFANSPSGFGLTGRSVRQLLRNRADRSRSDPIPLSASALKDWTQYALDAGVVGIEDLSTRRWWTPPVGFTMRRWLRTADARPVFAEDLRRHLKSVIPPVRACGHLEVRMIDAQDGENWVVPLTVVAGLLDDEPNFRATENIVATLPDPTREVHVAAASEGLADPQLASAAEQCIRLVVSSLDRLGVPHWAVEQVLSFAERYTLRARCPADHLLAAEAL